ncbi:hydratase [Geodermatophilus sp. DF01-2]|uniref:carbon-nitrogen hydrolase family protein n=1 Tax=Geodermatophilus sp. DF01-2 TaxID=2559610 RepID=UPI0010735460|nr:nitrilase-related carbon-nitrogen hydrolase [Geodermatophilus sp. DF01_2]TFV54290.1 hydratase [Geodermatophilus sp. DF01_2]
MSRLGVGVAQLECAPLDVAENIARTTAALRSAAAGGADLVVLPELVATGYVLDRNALLDRAESTAEPGPLLSAWAKQARTLGITVVGGFAERDGDRLFNSVVVIGPDGEIAGTYRKLHLFGRERDVFAPGDLGLPMFEIGGVRLGVVVCYDLRFPEAVRIHALRDVDLVAVPTCWVAGFDVSVPVSPTASIGQVDGALVQGNLNSVFLACADQVGAAEPFTFLGRSVVVDPYGRPALGPLDAVAPDVRVVEIDTDTVRAARHRGPGISPLEDRRTDVYGELLGYRDPAAADEAARAGASALQTTVIR